MFGSVISGISGIIGDEISASSAQSINQAQMQFNAQQADLNRQFQAAQQSSAENWMTQMSDSAMARRVADLKSAGLNPMLAISQGGASTPGISAPGGSMASAGSLQNPGAAFGNLGSQVSSAIQAGLVSHQKDLLDAQKSEAQASADYTRGPKSSETAASAALQRTQDTVQQTMRDQVLPAQASAARAAAGMDQAQTSRIQQQINSGDIAQQVKLAAAQTTLAGMQAKLAGVDALMDKMTAIEKQYAMPFVIQKVGVELQQMKLSIPEMNAAANYYETWAGQHVFLQKQIESGINTGANVIRSFQPFNLGTSAPQGPTFGPMGNLPSLSGR